MAEELYRRLMRLQTGLGRLDAVQRTYRLLARRLADVDADPDQEPSSWSPTCCVDPAPDPGHGA